MDFSVYLIEGRTKGKGWAGAGRDRREAVGQAGPSKEEAPLLECRPECLDPIVARRGLR